MRVKGAELKVPEGLKFILSCSFLDSNYILPAITETHFAFGGDYQLGKYWEIGFHGSKAADKTYSSAT